MSDDFIFGRDRELQDLKQQLERRKPLLVHGPEGVGKTLLSKRLTSGMPDFLYCPESKTIQSVFRTVMEVLWQRRDDRVRHSCGSAGLAAIRSKSAKNVKGVVMEALHDGKFCLVIDHIHRPRHDFAAAIREVLTWGGTPVITIARSAHMEDVGFLQAIYPDRSDRFEIKNFDGQRAAAFAIEISQRLHIAALNLPEFMDRVLEYSHGNPGAIVSLLSMAADPKYRSHDHIKIAPLYIDFRLNWNAQSAHGND